MVFCYQNCSDLLWEKNVLVFEAEGRKFAKFLKILGLEQFFLTVGQNNFGNKILFSNYEFIGEIFRTNTINNRTAEIIAENGKSCYRKPHDWCLTVKNTMEEKMVPLLTFSATLEMLFKVLKVQVFLILLKSFV